MRLVILSLVSALVSGVLSVNEEPAPVRPDARMSELEGYFVLTQMTLERAPVNLDAVESLNRYLTPFANRFTENSILNWDIRGTAAEFVQVSVAFFIRELDVLETVQNDRHRNAVSAVLGHFVQFSLAIRNSVARALGGNAVLPVHLRLDTFNDINLRLAAFRQ
jgi:hypothetical protein